MFGIVNGSTLVGMHLVKTPFLGIFSSLEDSANNKYKKSKSLHAVTIVEVASRVQLSVNYGQAREPESPYRTMLSDSIDKSMPEDGCRSYYPAGTLGMSLITATDFLVCQNRKASV